MSERWKYQIKVGGFFAVAILLFNNFFDENDNSFIKELPTSKFWIGFLFLLFFSIFVLGYLSWKSKDGKEYKWSDFFKKNKNKSTSQSPHPQTK